MTRKLLTPNKIIHSSSIETDGNKPLSEFLSSRFFSLNDSHNNVIIYGSSLAKQYDDIEHDLILDAAGLLIDTDELGTVNSGRIAVADGLGGGHGDEEEDNNIRKMAGFSCRSFLNGKSNLSVLVKQMNGESKTYQSKISSSLLDSPNASLAGITYRYNGDKSYAGEMINIGDGLIIILDKEYQIKQIIPARHVYRGFGSWSPSSLQMKDFEEHSIYKSMTFDEGDLIISMTDGIWGELESELLSSSKDYRDVIIKRLSFESLFNKFSGHPYPSTLSIAKEITHKAMESSLSKRKQLIDLIDIIEKQEFDSKSITTISGVLEYFRKNHMEKVATSLFQILFIDGLSDGVLYFKDIEIPLNVVMHDLKNRTAGDCSTISIVRVPYHLDELVRNFISNPSNREKIAKEISDFIDDDHEIDNAFSRLAYEHKSSSLESSFNSEDEAPVFKKETLNKHLSNLKHYLSLTTIIKKTSDYPVKMKSTYDYIVTQKLSKEAVDSLLELFHTELTPSTKGFLSLFSGSSDKRTFKKFQTDLNHYLQNKETYEKDVPSAGQNHNNGF